MTAAPIRPTSPARLALFLPTMDDGGAERVMLQLGQSFAARGHDVDLVVGIPGGPLDREVPSAVRRVDLGARRSLAATPRLARYLRRARPAALLSTLEHANVLAVWATVLARTRTRLVLREAQVFAPSDQMRGMRPHVERALMRRFYPRASAVIAVSKAVEHDLVEGLRLAPRRVHTIYNPVVTAELESKSEAPLDDPWASPGAPPIVLGVGRLTPQKDFATLVRAFAIVRRERLARLVVLGEGKERAMLETLARDLGVAGDVRFAGYDHNPFRWMRRASVFALSSVFEGLPGALIQAMACGCRVVSTDCPGGSREILEDGAHGPLVPVRDPEALAAAILELLRAGERGDGDTARMTYPLERFTERTTVDAYLDLLGVSRGATP